MLARRALLIIGFFGLTLAMGCSPYVDGFHYAPHPAIAEIQAATTQPAQGMQPPVTAYATIIGVRRADRDERIPLSVEVRLRLDNHGMQQVAFDPRTLDLSNGELMRFPPPIVQPMQAIPIQPGQSITLEANFPFPPGASYDNEGMGTLQLHWAVLIDGQPVAQVASFHRMHRYYYDPYWDYPPYPYGYPYFRVGGTIIIRR